eukprot:357715-Chlamydomonas_euryale.AAC.17
MQHAPQRVVALLRMHTPVSINSVATGVKSARKDRRNPPKATILALGDAQRGGEEGRGASPTRAQSLCDVAGAARRGAWPLPCDACAQHGVGRGATWRALGAVEGATAWVR